MKKNRELFIKRIYKDFVTFIKNDHNKICINRYDRKFNKYLKFKDLDEFEKNEVNYIIFNNNLNIIRIRKYEDNKYSYYYNRFKLDKLYKNLSSNDGDNDYEE